MQSTTRITSFTESKEINLINFNLTMEVLKMKTKKEILDALKELNAFDKNFLWVLENNNKDALMLNIKDLIISLEDLTNPTDETL